MVLNRTKLTPRHENVCASHLQSKLVEEVVEEVLDAVQHAVVQVTPSDVMKQCSGCGRDFVTAEPVELLMSVNCHLEG